MQPDKTSAAKTQPLFPLAAILLLTASVIVLGGLLPRGSERVYPESEKQPSQPNNLLIQSGDGKHALEIRAGESWVIFRMTNGNGHSLTLTSSGDGAQTFTLWDRERQNGGTVTLHHQTSDLVVNRYTATKPEDLED